MICFKIYFVVFKKFIRYIILSLILFFICVEIRYIFTRFNSDNDYQVLEQTAVDKNSQSCPIPEYHDYGRYPKDSQLLKNLKCPIKDDLVVIKNGLIHVLNNRSCSYECINWKTDFDFQLSPSLKVEYLQKVPCSFFLISCGVEQQIIFTATRDEKLINESKSFLKNKPKPSDVIIVSIDSMSYEAVKYYLPKTFKTLHNELNGVSFKKFNTMGDGTTVNLQALLTGTKDTETFEVRRRIAGSKTVDKLPWIWNNFKENGYVTLYAEEMTDYGTFQYRLNGFDKQPTDFYLRTPFMLAERKGLYKDYCFRGHPTYMEYFKFFNDFQVAYEDVPKFSFTFFSLLSHDDNKYISYLDDDLSDFLRKSRTNNPDAYILLYSDHGHRFTSRLTMEGKYEERLPFLGLSLPKNLENLKPLLKENSNVLISGLDVHATLEDIIGIDQPVTRGRHMSLLKPLPKDRNCEDIESLPHWCSCLIWKEILKPNENKKLIEIAYLIVSMISNFTLFDRKLCAELKLDSIKAAYRLDANKKVLRFKQSADVDGFVPDFSDKIRQTSYSYRFTLQTSPGDALFDLTVSVEETDNEPRIVVKKFRPEDVSRLNIYAPWIGCLSQRKSTFSLIPDIRKFCICKNIL